MSNLKFTIMISKKSHKADLEKKKPLFFEIGLTIALALVLIAFELSPKEKSRNNFLNYTETGYDEPIDVKITRVEKKMEKPKAIQIKIIENTVEIEEPEFNFDPFIDPSDGIEYLDPEPEDPVDTDDPFIIVEEMPRYRNGGKDVFHRHIQQLVRYPQAAVEMQIEGTVIVTFIVNKRGEISDIKILKGIDPLLDNEAISAIKQTEKWKPGRQMGRPVNVSMVMPVTFKLHQ